MTIQSSVATLRSWIIDHALPFWGTAGFDTARGSFIERADFAGKPLTTVPRRTMVQARQIYVFAQAAQLGWWPQGRDVALAAAHRMIDVHYAPDGQPGWIFSATFQGEIYDAKRDLYAQSFALFGLAWAYKLKPDPRFRDIARQTIDDLDRYFPAPAGGYRTDLLSDGTDLRQNPHMHLFEAMLAWYEASGESLYLARATALHGLFAGRFFQDATGTLSERFDSAWAPTSGIAGRICEPGHHYEWAWLLYRYAKLVGQKRDRIADALQAHANRHGRDNDGYVIDALLDDGTVHQSSRRCWPQTEAIKAAAADWEAGDRSAASRAAGLIDRLMTTFLGHPCPGGWVDHFDARRTPLVTFIPASTLYHVVLAAAEADRLWGNEIKS